MLKFKSKSKLLVKIDQHYHKNSQKASMNYNQSGFVKQCISKKPQTKTCSI